jgi:hypothetical protein
MNTRCTFNVGVPLHLRFVLFLSTAESIREYVGQLVQTDSLAGRNIWLSTDGPPLSWTGQE